MGEKQPQAGLRINQRFTQGQEPSQPGGRGSTKGPLLSLTTEEVQKPVQLSDRLCFTRKRHTHQTATFHIGLGSWNGSRGLRNPVTPSAYSAYSAFPSCVTPLLFFAVHGQGKHPHLEHAGLIKVENITLLIPSEYSYMNVNSLSSLISAILIPS